MYKSKKSLETILGDYKIEGRMFRYSVFVSKLYNYCKSLGFEKGKIMPSRAFCSDENQGYPIILITKHFGTFPFNHGRVGGIMATDRHGPHAEHGKDVVIIQASHVGYDPERRKFGTYRRMCTEDHEISASCGKIDNILRWYDAEYSFAKKNIFIEKRNNDYFITIDNELLDSDKKQGLFLNLPMLVESRNDELVPVESYSTSKCFRLSKETKQYFEGVTKKRAIGRELRAEYFFFKKQVSGNVEGHQHLEYNLVKVMPWIVTSKSPLLAAAKINAQLEFDRTFRTIAKEEGYRGKHVIYIAGINIDISPEEGQIFPLTKFVPWAAFVQQKDGKTFMLEQEELFSVLDAQSTENLDQINMDDAIDSMEHVEEIVI
jgi:hypothetical protein